MSNKTGLKLQECQVKRDIYHQMTSVHCHPFSISLLSKISMTRLVQNTGIFFFLDPKATATRSFASEHQPDTLYSQR